MISVRRGSRPDQVERYPRDLPMEKRRAPQDLNEIRALHSYLSSKWYVVEGLMDARREPAYSAIRAH
jgi:hypothetical protein